MIWSMEGVNQPLGVPSLLLSPSLSPPSFPLSPSFPPEAGKGVARKFGVLTPLRGVGNFLGDLLEVVKFWC